MNALNSIVDDALRKHAKLSDNRINKTLIASLENRLSSTIILPSTYKEAKKAFQRAYFQELLTLNLGNISKAAQTAGLNRRQIHRICSEVGVDLKNIRTTLVKPYNYLKQNVQDLIEEKIEATREKNKFSSIYKNMPKISEEVAGFLEQKKESYGDALNSFEKHYFSGILKLADNDVDKASRIAELSERSIQRRMKELAIA